jgi:hypothetical protein
MTPEERDLIARYIARVAGAPQAGGFAGGSVPPSQPPLPPIDQEADVFLAQQFQQYPEARYRITQTAIVQEAALAEAQNRIKRLEWELQQTRQAMQQAPQQSPQQRGFLSGLFGGGQPAVPAPQPGMPMGAPMGVPPQQTAYGQAFQYSSPPPQPQYPPSYQPGMFQRGGSGFLGSALTTAAGVAGGMVVGNALMGAFGGHNNSAQVAASPWGGAAANTGGGIFDNAGVVPTDPTAGYVDNTGYSDPFAGGGDPKDSQPAPSAWDLAGSADPSGGGFDSSGSDSSGSDNGGGGGGFDDNA